MTYFIEITLFKPALKQVIDKGMSCQPSLQDLINSININQDLQPPILTENLSPIKEDLVVVETNAVRQYPPFNRGILPKDSQQMKKLRKETQDRENRERQQKFEKMFNARRQENQKRERQLEQKQKLKEKKRLQSKQYFLDKQQRETVSSIDQFDYPVLFIQMVEFLNIRAFLQFGNYKFFQKYYQNTPISRYSAIAVFFTDPTFSQYPASQMVRRSPGIQNKVKEFLEFKYPGSYYRDCQVIYVKNPHKLPYQRVYFIKVPEKNKPMDNLKADLEKTISYLIQKANIDRVQNIVIPLEIRWPKMSLELRSDIILNGVQNSFNEIHLSREKRYLQTVRFVSQDVDIFSKFRYVFRKFQDSSFDVNYMRMK